MYFDLSKILKQGREHWTLHFLCHCICMRHWENVIGTIIMLYIWRYVHVYTSYIHMSVQALGVLGGSDVRIDTYVDRYIPLEVSRIASMGLAQARPNKPGSDTHKICISTYVHTTYGHTCVATAPHYFSIHTRTHNIADTILTSDVEDSHTCSTPHSLLLLHHHQSCCSKDWVEETTHNTTNKTVWLLRHILQVFTSHDTHYERKCM